MAAQEHTCVVQADERAERRLPSHGNHWPMVAELRRGAGEGVTRGAVADAQRTEQPQLVSGGVLVLAAADIQRIEQARLVSREVLASAAADAQRTEQPQLVSGGALALAAADAQRTE